MAENNQPKTMNHNKTLRSLEQKLKQRDKEFIILIENFKKLKTEYDKQYLKNKQLQEQTDVLSNAIQNSQNTEEEKEEEDDSEDSNNEQEEEPIEKSTTKHNKIKEKTTVHQSPHRNQNKKHIVLLHFPLLPTHNNTNTKNITKTPKPCNTEQTSSERGNDQTSSEGGKTHTSSEKGATQT